MKKGYQIFAAQPGCGTSRIIQPGSPCLNCWMPACSSDMSVAALRAGRRQAVLTT
jgi:hypothetical protein